MLGFGVRLDYLATNPAAKLERGNLVKGETEIFTPHQVKEMLNHALEYDLEFLPYRVFAFFCGIRPAGELLRLNWSNVSIAKRRNASLEPPFRESGFTPKAVVS